MKYKTRTTSSSAVVSCFYFFVYTLWPGQGFKFITQGGCFYKLLRVRGFTVQPWVARNWPTAKAVVQWHKLAKFLIENLNLYDLAGFDVNRYTSCSYNSQ